MASHTVNIKNQTTEVVMDILPDVCVNKNFFTSRNSFCHNGQKL